MRTLAAGALVAAMASLCGCGSSQPAASPQAGSAKPLPLPNDGWKPGDYALAALVEGPFHAVREGMYACAWLGRTRAAFMWPDGWTVRFKPTVQLLNAKGRVVAEEGQQIRLTGGGDTPQESSPCGDAGQWTFFVMQQ